MQSISITNDLHEEHLVSDAIFLLIWKQNSENVDSILALPHIAHPKSWTQMIMSHIQATTIIYLQSATWVHFNGITWNYPNSITNARLVMLHNFICKPELEQLVERTHAHCYAKTKFTGVRENHACINAHQFDMCRKWITAFYIRNRLLIVYESDGMISI